MTLKILLINPNRAQEPPTIPIGLEYLKTSLEDNGYIVRLLDLCFEENPLEIINDVLEKGNFDITGITIRNIDTSSFFLNKFYLPEIKRIIQNIKKHGLQVVLGGAGFSAMPYEILDYVNGDYGIIGPGEVAFIELLKKWENNNLNLKVINGWNYGINQKLTHFRGKDFDYTKYTNSGGIIGFQTHVGCQNRCPYCIEACTSLSYRKIPNIIEELKFLVNQGYHHFHLCDSEFNSNLEFSIEFCKSLIESKLDLKWALYMKPFPYNEQLFDYLHKSNAYLITLSVDSHKKIQKLNNYTYDDLKSIISYCKRYSIKLAIDLLCGYPGETKDSIEECIEFFSKNRPNNVGITFYYRIYDHTELADSIKNNLTLHNYLSRKFEVNDNFLKPIYFSQYDIKYFQDLIANDEIFRISGLKPGVNYQL
ncbi:MAG: B12-binding domain-containing radical SAM protein [Candidatus Helarchaeota archaeon]